MRRLEVYLRVALWVSALATLANLVYGLVRFHHESPGVGDLARAAFHSFALTLLPALVAAGVASAVVWLAGLLPAGKWLGRFLRAPLFSPDPPMLARAYAGLLGLGAFVAIARRLGVHFATRYHDQELSISALAASLAVAVLALIYVRDALAFTLEALFSRLRFLAVPAGFYLLASLIAVGAITKIALDHPALFRAYQPVDLAFGPALVTTFALIAWLYERRPGPLRPWVSPAIIALAVVSIAASSLSYGARHRHRVWVEERFLMTKRLYRMATHLTDRDGDGYSALFGGGDCDDRDPNVHPGAADPPGDGVDSDCFAGDGGPPISELSRGHFADSPLEGLRPNILFITVDALRPDHLGCFGYERETAPNIDALCAKSIRFHEAIAQSSRSIRSIPSMFTGFAPSQIAYGPEYLFPELLPENVLLAEVLAPHYQTAAVLGTNYFQRFKGLDQGFERFIQDNSYIPPRHLVRERAVQELTRMRAQGRPFFLWAYFFNVHEPYLQDGHPTAFGDDVVSAYDTEITLVDAEIGRLLATLERLDFSRPTVVVLHSDHGEAFWEHGLIGHSHNTHREEIRSTLLVHLPGVPGRDVHVPVPLSDLMPTVANLAGVELEHEIPSRSLVPLFTSEPGPEFVDRLIFSEVLPDGHFPWDEKSIQRGSEKLIYDPRSGRVQLYDHSSDPWEHRDLSDDRPHLVRELVGLLRSWIAETSRPEQRDEIVIEENRLEALPDEMTHPLGAVFGGLFRVAGLDLNATSFKRGETIEMDFYYEVLGETSKDLFFRVEVLDERGERLHHEFHARHHPMNGRYRTNQFRKGEILRDPVRLPVPRHIRPTGEAVLSLMVTDGRTPIPYASGEGSGVALELARVRLK